MNTDFGILCIKFCTFSWTMVIMVYCSILSIKENPPLLWPVKSSTYTLINYPLSYSQGNMVQFHNGEPGNYVTINHSAPSDPKMMKHTPLYGRLARKTRCRGDVLWLKIVTVVLILCVVVLIYTSSRQQENLQSLRMLVGSTHSWYYLCNLWAKQISPLYSILVWEKFNSVKWSIYFRVIWAIYPFGKIEKKTFFSSSWDLEVWRH